MCSFLHQYRFKRINDFIFYWSSNLSFFNEVMCMPNENSAWKNSSCSSVWSMIRIYLLLRSYVHANFVFSTNIMKFIIIIFSVIEWNFRSYKKIIFFSLSCIYKFYLVNFSLYKQVNEALNFSNMII